MAGLATLSISAFAGAFDSGSDAAYTSGWVTGTNGGTGFGAWNINDSHTFSGVQNGPSSNVGYGFAGGSTASQLDTNSFNGLFATRTITSPVGVGSVFSVDMDPGKMTVGAGDYFGSGYSFSLKNAAGDELVSVWGWAADYGVIYSTDPNLQIGGVGDSGIARTTTGWHWAVAPTSATTFAMTIDMNGGGHYYFTGSFANGNAGDIASMDIRSYGGVASEDEYLYFNNLKVESVPEPATLITLGAAGFGLIARRRKA